MSVKRGSVVLVRFPFSSGEGIKLRPALVIQADHNNRRLRNTVVAMITSTLRRASHEPTQRLIDIATAPGRQSGLLHTSVVKCENLFTIEQHLILRMIGTLPRGTMKRVDACLRASLGLE